MIRFVLCYFFLLFLPAVYVLPLCGNAQPAAYTKVLFANSPMPGSYFYSQVIYQSPSWVKNNQEKLPVTRQVFFTPGNALELTYTSALKGKWTATIMNHDIRGMDTFMKATFFTFRLFAKGNMKPGELPAIAFQRKDSTLTKPILLHHYLPLLTTGNWLTVRIPLADLGEDISPYNLNALLFSQASEDGKEHTLYIDQIEFGDNTSKHDHKQLLLLSAAAYEKHIDITWQPITDTSIRYVKVYRSGDGKLFYPVGIQPPWLSRYADFTDTTAKTFFYRISTLDNDYRETSQSNIIHATTHAMTDSQLLDMVQQANFRYYWEGAEPNSGLALEDIPGRKHMIAAGASGFGMMALIAGADRHFISRRQLLQRFSRISSFLLRAETFHGAYPHFIDGRTGKVVAFFGENDNGGDLVETAFLMQGVLAARQYFTGSSAEEKVIHERLDSVWRRVEWNWYRRETDSKYLYWHWSPDKSWIMNHRLIGWNETMITYILGISSPTHAVPAGMYYSGWASQSAYAKEYRTWGQSTDGLQYTNGNTYYGIPLAVGVSNGGPLFFTHYSFLGLNPHAMQDAYTNYFTNNQHIALINQRYCIENPGKHAGYGADAWGLTASDGPWDYSADEPVPYADHGKLTPTGALASFPYLPEASMAALKNYYRNYGTFLWGEYGFRDSFSPEDNWCSELFMGLNQAPITVMIENYRSGLLWKLFMSCPEVKEGLQRIAGEHSAGGQP